MSVLSAISVEETIKSSSPDVLQTILADVKTLIDNLSLGIPSIILKGPKKEPITDSTPRLVIDKAIEPEEKWKIAFGHMATKWPIEITLIAPNNADWVQNFSNYTSWRQQIEALFGPPYSNPLLPTTPGVFNLDIIPDEFLNREEMRSRIDRFVVKVMVSTAI